MALGSGVVASLVVADPHKLSTSTLFHIIDYVKLFLAFMLGISFDGSFIVQIYGLSC